MQCSKKTLIIIFVEEFEKDSRARLEETDLYLNATGMEG